MFQPNNILISKYCNIIIFQGFYFFTKCCQQLSFYISVFHVWRKTPLSVKFSNVLAHPSVFIELYGRIAMDRATPNWFLGCRVLPLPTLFCSTFLTNVLVVKASGPPYVLRMSCWGIVDTGHVKYFCPKRSFFCDNCIL